MLFGHDGKLYVTAGDSGTQEFAQDVSTVHGSLIRLNDDGTTPSDNPFTVENGYDAYDCRLTEGKVPANTSDDAVCAEIYANGLRNPFRMALNPNVQDKTLFAISDVGARVWEELNYAGTDYAGMNYGYKIYEGPCMRHSDSDCPIPEDPTFVDPFQ
jgi:glucose/arabinose dehydrogenase